LPYSASLVEGKFPEVHIQDPAYPRSSTPDRTGLWEI
jgi:hypothetical protein